MATERGQERAMLLAGYNYTEIADALGCHRPSLVTRNSQFYKVDRWDAFAHRVEREGIPNRLDVVDSFGYWFSGLFDGEGCLNAFSSRYHDRHYRRGLNIQINLRNDDVIVLHRIKDNIGVGSVYCNYNNRRGQPHATFVVTQIRDLAEIVVPLFDIYPLYSKKSREFTIWRGLVHTQYLATLGGTGHQMLISDAEKIAFAEGVQAIRAIRDYIGPGKVTSVGRGRKAPPLVSP